MDNAVGLICLVAPGRYSGFDCIIACLSGFIIIICYRLVVSHRMDLHGATYSRGSSDRLANPSDQLDHGRDVLRCEVLV